MSDNNSSKQQSKLNKIIITAVNAESSSSLNSTSSLSNLQGGVGGQQFPTPSIGLISASPMSSSEVVNQHSTSSSGHHHNHNNLTLNISNNMLYTSTSSFVSDSSSSSSINHNINPVGQLAPAAVTSTLISSANQTLSSQSFESTNNSQHNLQSNQQFQKHSSTPSSASNLASNLSQQAPLSPALTPSQSNQKSHNTNSNIPLQPIETINRLTNNNNNTNNSNMNTNVNTNLCNNTNSNSLNTSNEQHQIGHGHFFTKKTFHKPTYCHHCTEMLWGIIGQGFTCEVCNFVCHEKCQKSVVSPCSSIAHSLIKNPVSHCWSEPSHYKRKFCNICRKRLEDNLSVRCEICEYYVHVDCQVLAVNDCCETATYVPNRDLRSLNHYHHWREGNLPSNSKCVACKKTCWTSECLAGIKCEWCGITAHSYCRQRLSEECNFGYLRDIIVPPFAVSVPRISMNKETILGIQNKSKARSNSIELSSGSETKAQDGADTTITINNTPSNCSSSNLIYTHQTSNQSSSSSPGGNNTATPYGSLPSPPPAISSSINRENQSSIITSKKKDKSKQQADDEEDSKEMIRVYDGNSSFRKKSFRTIVVSKNCSYQTLLEASLRTFHINDDLSKYYLSIPLNRCSQNMLNDENQLEEVMVDEINPVKSIKANNNISGTKSSLLLRFKDETNEKIRIYPCVFKENAAYQSVTITPRTNVLEVIKMALDKFDISNTNVDKYNLIQVLIDQDANEHILNSDDFPLQIFRQLRKESLCNIRMIRFYLKQKEDPHGPSVAIFVGNLPSGLSQIQYELILTGRLRKNDVEIEIERWNRFDVIYYEYGSMVILYDDSEKAVEAYKMLKDSSYEGKQLTVLLLPTIQPRMIPSNVVPLLVFVNVKSGGQQGTDLVSSFRHLLNPHQVFDLQNGGPLPGLYVFRNIESYRILACGGDGTIGWVLACLDNVSQDAKCQSPPMAIVPLGTGNDLARVLRWGAGYTGAEEPINLLRDVIDAEDILLDRWTVVFHSDENKEADDAKKQQSHNHYFNQPNTNEDNAEIYVMNNYFGIGIDAEVALDFHTAREEKPNKFNSRYHNKKIYAQINIRKMINKSACKDINRLVYLEVDGKKIDLPQIEGIIILNIQSWAGGSNPWGPEKEDQFQKPTHYDGMLEVVGVKGVLHMGQIYGGISDAIRLAQGGRIKIRMNGEFPVQVDGEPWSQSPCTITILKSALKATMLKKSKTKIKRRNTEPNVNLLLPANNDNPKTDPNCNYLDPDGESEPF